MGKRTATHTLENDAIDWRATLLLLVAAVALIFLALHLPGPKLIAPPADRVGQRGELLGDDPGEARRSAAELRMEAGRQLDAGATSRALATLVGALVQDPASWETFQSLGAVYSARRQFELAEKALHHAVRLAPQGAANDVLAQLGWIFANRGEYARARTAFEEALRRDPRHFGSHYYWGMASLLQGDLAAAHEHLTKALEFQPRHPDALYQLGLCLAEQQRYEEACAAFGEVVKLSPESRHAYFHLSRMLRAIGQDEDAELAARKYDELNSVQQAIRQAVGRVEENPDDAVAYLGLGTLYAQVGRHAEALQALQDAVRLQPDNAVTHLAIGKVLMERRQLDLARRALQRALELDPALAAAWEEMGKAHILENAREEALDCYRKAVSLDGSNLVAVNNLAWLLADMNRELDTALELATQLVEEQPASAVAHDTMAWVRYHRGEFDLARQSIDRAVELAPDNRVFAAHQKEIIAAAAGAPDAGGAGAAGAGAAGG